MRSVSLSIKYLLAVAVVLLVFMHDVAAAEDIDRWANIESWEGSFSVYYHYKLDDPEGFYKKNYQYNGTINLDEKRIYKRRRQTEWKAVRWKGDLKASGSYDEEHLAESEVMLVRNLTRSNASTVVDTAGLKIDKRKGTYSLNIGFAVQTTLKAWMKSGPPFNYNNFDTEERQMPIGSPILPQPLPAAGMVLEGSVTFSGDLLPAFGEMAGISAPAGKLKDVDWGASWQLWPKGSNPETTLEYEEAGKDWLPEDDNTVKAVLKWDKNIVPSEVRFTLYEISREPGINLNSKDRNNELDLEFDEENKSRKFEIVKSDKTFIATKDELPTNEESIIIHAKDFGAYGKLKAELKVAGEWVVAKAKSFDLPYLPVPFDKNNNFIADKWEKDVGVYNKNYGPDFDEDPFPQGQKRSGDGFTMYEEYRGFDESGHVFAKPDNEQVKDGHVRMDPRYKDVFIFDPNDLFVKHYKPHNPAELNWHLIGPGMMKRDGNPETVADYRWVNFNTSKKHFSRNQYALVLMEGGSERKSAGITTPHTACGINPGNRGAPHPLKCNYKTVVYSGFIGQWIEGSPFPKDKQVVFREIVTTTVIHEIGHALGINHHNHLVLPGFCEGIPTDKRDQTPCDPKTYGVQGCALRYEAIAEYRHADIIPMLKTRYCRQGERYITFEADSSGKITTFPSHNCFGEINIKGD